MFVAEELWAQSCSCSTTLGSPGVVTNFEELVNSGALPVNGLATNEVYCVEGTLVLASTDPLAGYQFDGCTLIMGAGSEIKVQSGKTLQIFNSTIKGCSSLWKSIRIQEGATFLLIGSGISDGRKAVVIEGGSTIGIWSNHFMNNDVGVFFKQANPSSPQAILMVHVFEDNQFEAPSLMAPLAGQMGFSGVLVKDTPGVSLGSSDALPNIFDSMENGIRISRSSVAISNAMFSNVYDVADPWWPFENSEAGNCIFGGADSQVFVKDVLVEDSNTGIYVEKSLLDVSSSSFNKVMGGIRALFCHGKRIKIIGNEIVADQIGIHVGVGTPGHMDISENVVSVSPYIVPEGANILSEWGIIVNQLDFLDAQGNPPFYASSARIFQNDLTCYNALRAIGLGDVKGVRVYYNTIYTGGWQASLGGIRLLASDANIVYENNVDGDADALMGVFVEASPNSEIICNHTKGTYRGFDYAGISLGTQMVRNEMGSHHTALLMRKQSIIGVQWYTDNEWLEPSYPESAHHLDPDPNVVMSSAFHVNVQQQDYPFPAPIPDFWFPPGVGFSMLLSCNLSDPWQQEMELLRNNALYEDDYAIAQGGFVVENGYDEAMLFEKERYLYKKLLLYPELLNEDTIYQSFFLSHQGSPLADLVEIEKSLEELVWFEAGYKEQLSFYANLQEGLLDSLSLLVDAASQASGAELSAILSSEEEIFSSLSWIQDSSLSIWSEMAAHRQQVQSDLLPANAGISCVEVFETNHQLVNQVLIEQLVQDSLILTANQIAILRDVATQCPLSGGSAVYKARALLSSVESSNYSDTCPRMGGGGMSQGGVFGKSVLHPNPVEDFLSVNLSEYVDVEALEIWDVSGHLMLKFSVDEPCRELLDLSKLLSGTYLLIGLEGGKVVFSEFFVKK